jgi:hypothetical protein
MDKCGRNAYSGIFLSNKSEQVNRNSMCKKRVRVTEIACITETVKITKSARITEITRITLFYRKPSTEIMEDKSLCNQQSQCLLIAMDPFTQSVDGFSNIRD